MDSTNRFRKAVVATCLMVLSQLGSTESSSYDYADYSERTLDETVHFQRSTVDSESYVVSVVEFRPEQMTMPIEERTKLHLDEYSKLIRSPKARPSDIIVFPELTLNSLSDPVFVPEPSQRVVPCDDHGTILVTLSCLAREVQKYLVINLSEQFYIQQLAETVRYNTDVVFDRNGTVIARYRKYNLFREAGTSIPAAPELVTFETDFGVRFGVFTCFDILFSQPTLQLVKQGLRDFVFPAFWTSEPPFLASTQIFESWAYAIDANLIVSGTNYDLSGATGTGVFAGRNGALLAHFTGAPTRELYTVTVPKYGSQRKPSQYHSLTNDVLEVPQLDTNGHRIPGSELDRVVMGRDFLEQFTTLQLNPSAEQDTIGGIVCSGFFCCDFTVSLSLDYDHLITHYYRLAVFDGVRTFQGFADAHVSICAVIACRNQTIASCGLLLENASPYFQLSHISITGQFQANGTLAMPSTLNTAMYSLDASHYRFSGDINRTTNLQTVTMNLTSPASDLQTFGIYAFNHKNFEFFNPIELPERNGEQPPPQDDGGAASLLNRSTFVILIGVLAGAWQWAITV